MNKIFVGFVHFAHLRFKVRYACYKGIWIFYFVCVTMRFESLSLGFHINSDLISPSPLERSIIALNFCCGRWTKESPSLHRSKRGTAGISGVCITHPRMISDITSLEGNFCGNDDEEGRSSSYLVYNWWWWLGYVEFLDFLVDLISERLKPLNITLCNLLLMTYRILYFSKAFVGPVAWMKVPLSQEHCRKSSYFNTYWSI